MKQILIVDDHKIVRDALVALLSIEHSAISFYTASNGEEALSMLAQNKFEVVISNINMPIIDGLTMTQTINEQYPEIRVIILSMMVAPKTIKDAISFGAVAFISKSSDFSDLLEAIKNANRNNIYLCPQAKEIISQDLINNLNREKTNQSELSEKELKILQLICKGYTHKEIATTLNLSHRTVERHRMNIMHKTKSRNLASLIIHAIKNEIIEI